MIKVFIVEDHSVVVEGIRSLLQNENEFDVIGYTDTGEGCLKFFSQQKRRCYFNGYKLAGYERH